jgi:hypothetical protein
VDLFVLQENTEVFDKFCRRHFLSGKELARLDIQEPDSLFSVGICEVSGKALDNVHHALLVRCDEHGDILDLVRKAALLVVLCYVGR